MSLPVPPQNYWYPRSSYACHQGDEPQIAKCGVCGVWWGRQVRLGIKRAALSHTFKVPINVFECCTAHAFLRLFEMGFAEQLQEIIRRFPDTRQTLLFSATLPKLLVEFARAGMIWKIATFVIVNIYWVNSSSLKPKHAFSSRPHWTSFDSPGCRFKTQWSDKGSLPPVPEWLWVLWSEFTIVMCFSLLRKDDN